MNDTQNIENQTYHVGFEIYKKTVSGSVDTERETVYVSDDQKKILSVDTLIDGFGNDLLISNFRYQYDNHLGSACLELDENAAIITYEEYHPFGTTSYRSGKTETEVSRKRYKYVGKERDEETGLYYYGARYYAAWVARFVSCDPLQFKYPHYTPYQYAGNKPITYIDLDGLEEAKINETQVTHFFDINSGKYLGQIDNFKDTGITESDLIDGMALRTIEKGEFNAIKTHGEFDDEQYGSTVASQSSIIKIDKNSFSAFQEINKKGHIAGTPEKSLFMILDITDKQNPILRAEINKNSVATNESVTNEVDKYGDYSTVRDDKNKIIVGQTHSHPLLDGTKQSANSFSTISFYNESKVNGPGVSTEGKNNDRKGAIDSGYPVYAIQSYDRSGKIYKVDQYGQLNTKKTGRRGNKEVQVPVGNIDNLGTAVSQFNIILDAFLTNANFKRRK